jgi:hypothetical protein
MDETTTQRRDLDAQIAVHLFGWRWLADAQLWRDPDGLVCDAQTFRRQLPASSRVPEATALVWQWLEGLTRVREIYFGYDLTSKTRAVGCDIVYSGRKKTDRWDCARGKGPTWPEALCRAALALAELLKQEEK